MPPPPTPGPLLKQVKATAPDLPADARPDAEVWLRRALLDRDALDRHVAVLGELYRATFPPPPRGPAQWPPPPRPDLTGFAYTAPLSDGKLEGLLDRGLGALDDRDLADFLLNPVALYDAAEAIDEVQPDVWVDEMIAAGRELAEAAPAGVTTPAPAVAAGRGPPAHAPLLAYGLVTTPAPPPVGPTARPASGVRWDAALAAGLLIAAAGVVAGRWAFPRTPEVAVRGGDDTGAAGGGTARAGVRSLGPRGADDDADIRVEGDRDGFATVVLLFPRGRPLVLPQSGGTPLRVRPGEPASTGPLPPVWADATRGLVVVTPTRSADAVRDLLKARPFGPDRPDELTAYLRAGLAAENLTAVTFGAIDLRPPPTDKR